MVSFKSIRWLALQLLILGSTCAEDKTSVSYLRNQLKALGLPDTSGKTLVTIAPTVYDMFHNGLKPNPLIGRAWVAPTPPKTKAKTILISGVFSEVMTVRSLTIERDSLRPLNLKEELEQIHLQIEELKGKRFPEIHIQIGRVVCFALNLDQNGQKAEAQALIDKLGIIADAKKLENEAYNHLAIAKAREAFLNFQTHRDWKRYATEIEALLERTDQRWEMRSGAVLLLKRLKMRASGNLPKPKGYDKLAPRLKSILDDLCTIETIHSEGLYSKENHCWLLPDSWTWRFPKETRDVDLRVRALGVKGMKLLMLVRDDFDTLTYADGTDAFSLLCDYGIRVHGSPKENFRELPRPMTRGEVAALILEELHPVRYNNSDMTLPGLKRFVETYHDKPDQDVALYVLTQESLPYEWYQASWNLLLRTAQKKPLPQLQSLLKNRRGRHDYASDLARYVAVRGRPALAFLIEEANSKDSPRKTSDTGLTGQDLLLAVEPEDDGVNAQLASDQKALDNLAKTLAKSPFGTGLSDFVEFVVEQKDPSELLTLVVITRLSTVSLKDAVSIVMTLAAKEESATRRIALANLLQAIKVPDFRRDQGKNRGALEDRQRWEMMFADTRESEGESPNRVLDCLTIGDLYIIAYERLFNQVAHQTQLQSQMVYFGALTRVDQLCRTAIEDYGAHGRRFALQRVGLRMQGTPPEKLPPYPMYESNKPSDSIATVLRAVAANRERLLKEVADLSLQQVMLIWKILEKNSELNAALLPHANLIVAVDIQFKDPKVKTRFAKWKGKQVSPELVRDLYAFCCECANKKKEADCMLLRRSLFAGTELIIIPKKRRREIYPPPKKIAPPCGVGAQLMAGNQLAGFVKRFTPMPTKDPWWAVTSSPPSRAVAFWDAVNGYCGNASEASSLGFIRFVTKEDYHGN